MKTAALVSVILAGLVAGAAVAAEPPAAGEVIFVQGVTSAQRPGEAPRFLAKGDAVAEGDTVTTGSRGFAVLGLKDGTKMTLRPSTAFAIEKFRHNAGEENLLMRLFRGGLRAITGLIGKRNPTGVSMGVATATIGIRGTAFDARICGEECRREAQNAKPVVVPPDHEPAAARVALLQGRAEAVGRDGKPRPITRGAAVYNGESVRTADNSYAVLAFRDRSRLTLTASSEFRLDNVRFAPRKPEEGNFVLRLVRGGLRLLTGLVGKREPRAVSINTATSTIGIRGTGVDVYLRAHCFDVPSGPGRPARQECAEDAVYSYTWDGATGHTAAGKEVMVEKDTSSVFNPKRGAPELLAAVPPFMLEQVAPRPDRVDVDIDALYATVLLEDYAPGFYVGVEDGHVNFAGAGGFVDLGAWEAGVMLEGSDRPVRIEPLPGFLFNDPYPRPDEASERTLRLIELINPGGESGGGICEVK